MPLTRIDEQKDGDLNYGEATSCNNQERRTESADLVVVQAAGVTSESHS